MKRVLSGIKSLGVGRKNSMSKSLAVLFILAAVTAFLISASYSDDINNGLSNNLVRFHVIANSDSHEDQALKLKVRDVIIDYMKGQLQDSKSIDETKLIINRNKDKIEELARNEIAKNKKSYPVKAKLGIYPFPTKLYGDIALPAGNYQALRIEIGEAKGANWWCVLFPPLCFVDATHGTVPDSVKRELKDKLTDEEYEMVASGTSDKDIPVKVKFKVVEIFQSSKIKFSGMLSSLLK